VTPPTAAVEIVAAFPEINFRDAALSRLTRSLHAAMSSWRRRG
jgi:hypothetical protein